MSVGEILSGCGGAVVRFGGRARSGLGMRTGPPRANGKGKGAGRGTGVGIAWHSSAPIRDWGEQSFW